MIPITPVIPNSSTPATEIAENQPEYLTLPSVFSPYVTSQGMSLSNCVVTNRWKLTWKERFQVFLTGNLWHQSATFNQPLQPIMMHTACPLKESDLD